MTSDIDFAKLGFETLPEEEWRLAATFPLDEEDDENMESGWHRTETDLLIDSVLSHFHDQTNFYVGGNQFLYFAFEQAETHSYRGPDFFYVKNVALHPLRRCWVVWREQGRYPNTIIELLSPRTAREDRTTKKDIYEQTFRTPEYFLYDPSTNLLEGWRLGPQLRYLPLTPDERGWIWSEELHLWLGPWTGEFRRFHETWLRFYTADGKLVLLKEEAVALQAESERQRAESERQRAESECQRAESERQRAERERQRADSAEAEIARLKALLGPQDTVPPNGPSGS